MPPGGDSVGAWLYGRSHVGLTTSEGRDMTDLRAIGTRKGLWLARSDDDRRTWTLGGPHLLAQEVAAVSIDTRRSTPRVLAGIQYGHWGPTVMWSDDLGASWQETDHGAIRFPEGTDSALA